MVQEIFNGKAFLVNGVNQSLDQLMGVLADAAREDAFLGAGATADTGGLDYLAVTTVLNRGKSMYSWRGLSANEIAWVRRIIRPRGPLPEEPLQPQVHQRGTTDGNENFLVTDLSFCGVFIWMARLLKTIEGERNAVHLRCYHENTNYALLFARQEINFLKEAVRNRSPQSVTLGDLLDKAYRMLDQPPYKCAALQDFLGQQWVRNQISAAKPPEP